MLVCSSKTQMNVIRRGALAVINGYFKYFRKSNKGVEVFSKLFLFCGFQAIRIWDTICSLLNWKSFIRYCNYTTTCQAVREHTIDVPASQADSSKGSLKYSF